MINSEKLTECIVKYKTAFDKEWANEKYKWIAVKWFQDNWDINADDFYEMFTVATEKTANLLASMNNFPRGMILEYIEFDKEAVRAMFIDLYDESKLVTERIINFMNSAQELCDRYTPAKQHYQRPMAITVYLWLRYPDKYDIFKYSVCKKTCQYLKSSFGPKKGYTVGNIQGNAKLIGQIRKVIKTDNELIEMYENKLDEKCYQDKTYRILASDVSFYIANYLSDVSDNVIREDSLLPEKHEELVRYTREDFLSEVYMTGEKYDTLKALLLKKQNIILQGAPGVGKTFAAKRLAYSIMGSKDDSRVEFIQFHQNYSYEDFIMGYKPSGAGFELQNGIFYKFCMKAANDPERPYFFIIDEINRGNMSKIFGELLMLIEKDYRGTKATLAYNGLQFAVPKNLYIIGMMNTADRSLAMIDYALRRRFSFYAMEPGFEAEGFKKYLDSINDDTLYSLVNVIVSLNKAITEDSSLGIGFCIGHSYFCGQTGTEEDELMGWMTSVIDFDIMPMLEEYWFDEPDKVRLWRNRLRGVFNN